MYCSCFLSINICSTSGKHKASHTCSVKTPVYLTLLATACKTECVWAEFRWMMCLQAQLTRLSWAPKVLLSIHRPKARSTHIRDSWQLQQQSALKCRSGRRYVATENVITRQKKAFWVKFIELYHDHPALWRIKARICWQKQIWSQLMSLGHSTMIFFSKVCWEQRLCLQSCLDSVWGTWPAVQLDLQIQLSMHGGVWLITEEIISCDPSYC